MTSDPPTGSGPPVIEARELSRRFGGLWAVRELSISVAEREIFGLIGPNGSGKTTTLNLLSGFDAPTTGEIRIGSHPAKRAATARSAFRLGVTRTFQAVRLFETLTVMENVEVAALAGSGRTRRREARRRAEQELEALGLMESRGTLAGALPYGVQRRVEMARALVTDPALVLLDEPAAGMSRQETDDLQQRIADVRSTRGAAFVVVEHDIRLILGLCDRVAVLDSGIKIAEGPPEDIRTNTQVKESYMGSKS